MKYHGWFLCADCPAERDIGWIIVRRGIKIVLCKTCYGRYKRALRKENIKGEDREAAHQLD